MPEDVAIALRKSKVDTCTDDRDIDRPKSADRQTDRQTAFQLYIVEKCCSQLLYVLQLLLWLVALNILLLPYFKDTISKAKNTVQSFELMIRVL